MKKILFTALLTAGLAVSSYAQAVSADIILGFRDTANSGAGNLMLDLGNANALLAGAAAGNGTYTIGNLTNAGTFGSSTINSIFGAGWSSSTTLKWGAIGTVNATDTTNANGVKNTLFATKSANSSLLDGTPVTTNTGSGYVPASTTTQNNASTLITPMYTNFGAGSFRQVATTGTGAWSKQAVPTSGSTFFGIFGSGPTVFENATNISGSYVASDLWKISPTSVGTGTTTFLGTLAIYADGAVTFSTQAIPEPSTYAAILGVATLGFAALRRRKQALVA